MGLKNFKKGGIAPRLKKKICKGDELDGRLKCINLLSMQRIKREDMLKTAFLFIVSTLLVAGPVQKMVAQGMALKTNLLYDATTTINLGYEVALNPKTTLDIWVNYNPWSLGKKWVGLHETAATGPSASERDAKLRHLMLQPEVRWWTCEKFNGHFFGIHLHGGLFNVGALKLPFDIGRAVDENGAYLGTYPATMRPVDHGNLNVQGVAYKSTGTAYPGLGQTPGTELDPNDKFWGWADRDGIYVNSFEGWFAGAGVSYGYHLIVSTRFSMEFTIGAGYAYINYDKTRCTDCKKKLDEGIYHYFGPTRAGLSLIYMLK